MTKQSDIDDLLGEAKPAKTKAKAAAPKADAKAEKPAAKKAAAPKAEAKPAKADKAAAAPAKPAKADKAAAPKAKAVKEPVVFADGEREDLMKRAAKLVKKPITSKDLAAKLEIPTRKLRPVLYSMQRAGSVVLELGASRTAGLTVSPAA